MNFEVRLQTLGANSELASLLEQARLADPGDRILLRDPIAAFGEMAIDPLADWLGDTRLAAFAIRVLERVGRLETLRPMVVEVLAGVDSNDLPAHLRQDIGAVLDRLSPPTRTRAPRTGAPGRRHQPGEPGERGRQYWAMRTSPWERPFVWSELLEGRLRQGWGALPEQDLRLIADAVAAGHPLSEAQHEARRSRRMLETEPDGMRVGDIIVTQNLPRWGVLSIVRLEGAYRYEMSAAHTWNERFAHLLPVQLLAKEIDRGSSAVSEGLRRAISLPGRLYNITRYGGDVEALLQR